MSLDAVVRLSLGPLQLDAEISVPTGTLVVVVGPNAAGKTTLLRALAGLQPLDEGRVVLDGQVLEDAANRTRLPPHERPVGVVFQDYLLFPHLSVQDNVAFGLRERGVGRHESRRVAVEWLGRVGLAEQATRKPRALSGGQAQRVALVRALATRPRLLLLDEPLSALDAGIRPHVRRELRRQLDSFDGTRLLVTHDPLDAIALADQIVVLEDGRVAQSGTVEDITARPRSRYVAELIGLNLFRGRAFGDHVDIDGDGRLTVAGAGSGPVFAVFHPRAVTLHRELPEGTPRNVWKGEAAEVDFEGTRVRVRVTGEIPVVAEVTPAAVAELRLGDGGGVWVSVKATEIDVYPA